MQRDAGMLAIPPHVDPAPAAYDLLSNTIEKGRGRAWMQKSPLLFKPWETIIAYG